MQSMHMESPSPRSIRHGSAPSPKPRVSDAGGYPIIALNLSRTSANHDFPIELSADIPPLFAVVPNSLFAPLASANHARYWALLCRLYEEFFGPDAPLPPSDGFPRRDITSALERYLLADDPWEEEDGAVPGASLGDRANQVHERLRSAGWLRQERVGAREMVTMMPMVAQFFATLVEFAERGPAFVSAKMRSIELQLRQILNGQAAGDALDEAADQARRLLTQLATVGVRVRDLMPELSRAESTAQFVRAWFERYVAELFIGDYADLHKSDHPLARRSAVLAMVDQLEDAPQRERLLGWYANRMYEGDTSRAAQRLARSVARLKELSRIDEYLGRLDDDIRHANQRALAFLDYRLRTPARFDLLLRRAIAGAGAATEDTLRLPVPSGGLIDSAQLRGPRRKPAAITRSANALREPTPEQRARLSLLRRMKRARLVTPEDLARYVARHLPPDGPIDSRALTIAGIADLRAWQTLFTLALRGHRLGGLRRDDPLARLARGFHVELRDDAPPRESAYLQAPHFAIHRNRLSP